MDNRPTIENAQQNFYDISKICRICLKTDVLISILSTAFTVRPIDMIRKLDLFKINPNEGLPISLCQSCICHLVAAYNLKQQSEMSEIRLRDYLNSFSSSTISTYAAALTGKQITFPGNRSGFHIENRDYLEIPNKNGQEQIYVNESISYENVFDSKNISSSDNIEVENDILNDVDIDVNSLTTGSDREEESTELNILQEYEPTVETNVVESVTIGEEDKEEELNRKSSKKKQVLDEIEKCDECGKSFSYSGYLEIHKRIHTGQKPFQCEICNKSFSQSGNLTLHMRSHNGERRYQCELCSKLFTTSSNLTAHKKIHSEDRNFKCTLCLRTFKTNPELKSHAGIHSGLKTQTCKFCQKSFYKTSYLNIHIRTVHKGEKKYKCSECGKVFSSSSNLGCHFRIHSGEKPYKCEECGMSFNQSSALTRHSKSHRKNKKKLFTRNHQEELKQSSSNCLSQNNVNNVVTTTNFAINEKGRDSSNYPSSSANFLKYSNLEHPTAIVNQVYFQRYEYTKNYFDYRNQYTMSSNYDMY